MHLQVHCLRGQVLNAWWRPVVWGQNGPQTLVTDGQIKGHTRGDAGCFGCPGFWSSWLHIDRVKLLSWHSGVCSGPLVVVM